MTRTNRPESGIAINIIDADDLEENVDPSLLILQIERRDIEACNLGNTLEKLYIISDTAQNARLYRESLVFQVNGYNNDRRELPEIPEVRRFFAKLIKEWPHWLWYLSRNMGSIALLLSILCKVKIHKTENGFGTEFISSHEVGKVLVDLFERGNAMFVAHGITEDEAKESADSAVEEMLGE